MSRRLTTRDPSEFALPFELTLLKRTALGLALPVLPALLVAGARPSWAQAAAPGAEVSAISAASKPPRPTSPPLAVTAPSAEPSTQVHTPEGTGVHADTAGTPRPAPQTPPDGERDAVRYRDAHADHVLLLPTGETHPRGTFYVSDYDILLAQVGYALSDSTEVTLSGAPVLGADHIVPLDLSVKTVVVRDGTLSLALLGSASGLLGVEEASGFIGRAGGALTLCRPAWTCRASFSFATDVALLGPASVVFGGVGGVYRFDGRFALLAELDTAVPLGARAGQLNGIAGGAGVRFSGEHFGLDLGLFKAGNATTVAVPLLPLVVLTWRSEIVRQ